MSQISVGYCKPDNLKEIPETLGAYLEGEREENSMYNLKVGIVETCVVLCSKVRNRIPVLYGYNHRCLL